MFVLFLDQHKWFLTQPGSWNLIYTAISRARNRCFIIGDEKLFLLAQQFKTDLNPTVFLREFNEFELSDESEQESEQES